MLINEFAKLTGVSVRTLHYYDEIGLLKPSRVDNNNGYRYYENDALVKLQEILFYRELEFSLHNILDIISSPNYDKSEALIKQRELLCLKKQRIERLIDAIDEAKKGVNTMSFSAFDNTDYKNARDEYAQEAKERWGNTDAYKQSTDKCADYSKQKFQVLNTSADEIFKEFSDCMKNGESPKAVEVQALVRKWQNFISENYYTCTNEILAGLAQMYVEDERFKKNLDRFGEGNAEFISNAISEYCK